MLDLRHAGARSEELSRGGAVRRFLGGALEVERESFVVGGLATLLLGSPGCSTALGHDSMRLMRSLIAIRSSSSIVSASTFTKTLHAGGGERPDFLQLFK